MGSLAQRRRTGLSNLTPAAGYKTGHGSNSFIAAQRAARNGPAHWPAAGYLPSGLLHEMHRLQKLVR